MEKLSQAHFCGSPTPLKHAKITRKNLRFAHNLFQEQAPLRSEWEDDICGDNADRRRTSGLGGWGARAAERGGRIVADQTHLWVKGRFPRERFVNCNFCFIDAILTRNERNPSR